MTIDRATARGDERQVLLDSLLYAVSHDLRSPLLTMTLSADLVEHALGQAGATSEAAAVAIDSMRQGAADMERMLQTLMLLSRARRREPEPGRGALRVILGGYEVTGADETLLGQTVCVDPLLVRELLDAAAGDDALPVQVRSVTRQVELEFPVPALEHGPTPLHAVTLSLKQYAGTVVETLAVGQVHLEREGAGVRGEAGRVVVSLPLAGGE